MAAINNGKTAEDNGDNGPLRSYLQQFDNGVTSPNARDR